MIVGIPIIIVAVLILLLYIPSVQKAVVDKACKEIAAKSGYDIEIGSIALSFPLSLKATDFKISKEDTLYFQGKNLEANISLQPLFTGKVEVNYISLENLDIDTHNMLSGVCVDGKVGYIRLVARNADLVNSIADIRQLHIADTELNIVTLPDTATSKESSPLQWVINLHSGKIKNCSIGISVPQDSLKTGIYVERLQLSKGNLNIPTNSFAIKEFALNNSIVKYDKGEIEAEQAPLEHIEFNSININADNLRYNTLSDISANISQLTFVQPDGITITDAKAHFTSNKDSLLLHELSVESQNGSYIYGKSTIPQQALLNSKGASFSTTLSASISKPDLARFVTPQVYEQLHYFNNQLLNIGLSLSGNINNMAIDTVAIEFPGVATVNANGNIQNILNTKNASGEIAFSGEVDDIRRFTGGNIHNDSINGKAEMFGKCYYNNGEIDSDIAIQSANGQVDAKVSYDIQDKAYETQINIGQLALSDIIPDIPLHKLTMNMKAQGRGIEIFSDSTIYNVDLVVDTLYFADYRLHSLNAKATQEKCISSIGIEGNDKSLLFGIDATTTLAPGGIENHTTIELTNADLRGIGLVDSMLKTSTNIDITATTDFKESHSLRVSGDDINIITRQNHFTPESLFLDFATSPQKTSIRMTNGDLDVDGEMNCGYNNLFAALEEIAEMHRNIMNKSNSLYHLNDYEKVLPRISLKFNCGENNVMHNFLAFAGIETGAITIDADISQSRGLNIKGNAINFSSNGINLDSIKFATRQNDEKLNYIIGASNLTIESLGDENSYNALLYGNILCDTVTTNLILRDNVKNIDSKAGATTVLSPGYMNIHFNPEALLLGAPFTFSKNNYINIGKAMSIDADVTFSNSNDSGFNLYTIPDKEAKYNINLDFFNIHLSELAKAFPSTPDVNGNLSAKLNYRQTGNGDVFSCNANIDGLTYNGDTIGKEDISLVYSPTSNEAHNISCIISHDNKEIAHINSGYQRGNFDGSFSLTRLPLNITQAFIDKEGVLMNGYLNSEVNFKGTLSDMKSYGYMHFDSVYAYSPMLGAVLHPADEKIMIENNQVNLQRFYIYDKANTPFVINGNVDITNLLNPKLSLRLNASNYEILNTPQEAGKMVYGKMYVDLRSMIRGTLDDIRMMGDLTVLSNSNFAYVIPETAFDSNKDLDGLVEFVNFNDTTTIVQQEQPKIDLGNINANLNITIQEGANLSLDFDSSRESYVSIEGEGNLNATYNNRNGFEVTGVYKLNGGQVKLTLPIIPLKTFYIQEGGRLTWTGDLFNPILDVTALERTTVSVEFDDNSIQPVVFNTGVVVSNSINDLAIDFTMSSPENAVIQNQLNELDRETLSRYAVAMIITGTYLGGRQGVTAASALSSFLDAKINEISGTAIKNFDVNIGINDALNAETGNAYKNYSFSFSKRFFNDRITVVIGGEVNSGDRPDRTAGNNSFINNVSLEWKLNEEGNRYIRIFYDRNYQSLLEGEITETGVGYVYKRKLNKLKELFMFKKKKSNKEPDKTNRTKVKQ